MVDHAVNTYTNFEDSMQIRSSLDVPQATINNASEATVHALYHVTYAYGANFPEYLKSLTAICLFTLQLTWLCD